MAKPTGKTTEALRHSRNLRGAFLQRYGLIPESILRNDRTDCAIDLSVKNGRGYEDVHQAKHITNKALRHAFDSSGRSCRGKGKALSRFPQNIGRLLLNFYCKEHGTVYDPFAGHNSRMQLVYESERDYIGVDLSHTFMQANKKIQDKLIKRQGFFKNPATIKLIEGSSADVPGLKNNSADFTITSPPYWDLEWYGDEPDQLGKITNYFLFLDGLANHIRENYRILRPGCFACWCVNDFRRKNIFYPYHSDLLPIFEDVGFEIFNIYIMDLGPPIGSAFVQSIEKSKCFPKRHEYVLLFRKPDAKKKQRSS